LDKLSFGLQKYYDASYEGRVDRNVRIPSYVWGEKLKIALKKRHMIFERSLNGMPMPLVVTG